MPTLKLTINLFSNYNYDSFLHSFLLNYHLCSSELNDWSMLKDSIILKRVFVKWVFQITSKLSKSNYGVGDESKTHQVLFDSSNLGSENKQATCHRSFFYARTFPTNAKQYIPAQTSLPLATRTILFVSLLRMASVCLKGYNPRTNFFLCLIGSTAGKHLSLEG